MEFRDKGVANDISCMISLISRPVEVFVLNKGSQNLSDFHASTDKKIRSRACTMDEVLHVKKVLLLIMIFPEVYCPTR